MHFLELRVKELGRVCLLGLFLYLHGEGSQFPAPVPCCGSLAIFTRKDGPKRVKVMLRRRGEFIEILCLVCHGTGVFSFSWLEYENCCLRD